VGAGGVEQVDSVGGDLRSMREAVSELIARGCSMPCSTSAQAFTQIVPAASRFQIALDKLLPVLDSSRSDVRDAAYSLFT
jgi:hypothetical protein